MCVELIKTGLCDRLSPDFQGDFHTLATTYQCQRARNLWFDEGCPWPSFGQVPRPLKQATTTPAPLPVGSAQLFRRVLLALFRGPFPPLSRGSSVFYPHSWCKWSCLTFSRSPRANSCSPPPTCLSCSLVLKSLLFFRLGWSAVSHHKCSSVDSTLIPNEVVFPIFTSARINFAFNKLRELTKI